MSQDTIVVGAGVAGLRCAGELHRAGRKVLVLERARGIGGRCATRRFEGQPVDFGPMFLHGRHPGFLAALREVEDAATVSHWPRQVEGNGMPCQPGAMEPSASRIAFAEGVKAFPRHLAKGLDIRLETDVTDIHAVDGGFLVTTGEGTPLRCRDLVLALALEQSRRLLKTLPASDEVSGIRAMMGLFSSVSSLTVIAGYALDAPAPPWDLFYPGDSDVLQLIAQDSAKRAAPRFRVLVCQARPAWSRIHLEDPPEQWASDLLKDAARPMGDWVRKPLWTHPHRWRYARMDPTGEMAQPVQIVFPGGPRLGLAGDVFSPGGGVQAAWLSGTRMAQRLMQKEQA